MKFEYIQNKMLEFTLFGYQTTAHADTAGDAA